MPLHGHDAFSFAITLADEIGGLPFEHHLHVGCSMTGTKVPGTAKNTLKRSVKFNESVVRSYKELMDIYRVVTVTEDDINLVAGEPEQRRLLLDQSMMLTQSHGAKMLSDLRRIVEQRSTLLARGVGSRSCDTSEYMVWTERLFKQTALLQQERYEIIRRLATWTDQTLHTIFPSAHTSDSCITMTYIPKVLSCAGDITFEEWFNTVGSGLQKREYEYKRTLFGAHLDDCLIEFHGRSAKVYASRGQQKIIALVIRLAQMRDIVANRGSIIALFDDFLTDLDTVRIERMLEILSTFDAQCILTAPYAPSHIVSLITAYGGAVTNITP